MWSSQMEQMSWKCFSTKRKWWETALRDQMLNSRTKSQDSRMILDGTYIIIRSKEAPAALIKESLRIVHNGLHNFAPVQALNSLSVTDIAWTVRKKKKVFSPTPEMLQLERPTMGQCYWLEPLLDVVQLLHWNSIDHGHFTAVVFEDKDHVKVLQMKLHTFEVHQLQFIQSNQKEGLKKKEV